MPKKHDPKKMDTSMSMKKKKKKEKKTLDTEGPRKKIYSHIAMSSCYPNKRERDS